REVQLALFVLMHVEYLVIEERSALVVEQDSGPTLGAEPLVLLFGSGDHGAFEVGFLLALLLHRESRSSDILLRPEGRDRVGGCIRQGKHGLPFRCSRRLRFTPSHRRWAGYAPANSGCFLRSAMISRRSVSSSPPQTPKGSCTVSACRRHSAMTGQLWQICLARATRFSRARPRSPSGWKKTALSMFRQLP